MYNNEHRKGGAIMKKLIQLLMVVAIVCGLTIANITPIAHAEQDKNWEKIKESGELKVGLSADYAPMEFEHNVNGKNEYAGVDIELAKRLLKITILN